jgi:ABC-type transport system substrate-binding protein
MLRCACLVAVLLTIGVSPTHAQATQITIAQPAEATTMDPGRSTQVLTVNYFYNLYDSLTRWDAALQLQPGLATSWKPLGETTWEFTLRPGVKFHDGARLTADDVRATIERNLVPGKTVVTSGFATIESVQAVNPGTVRVIYMWAKVGIRAKVAMMEMAARQRMNNERAVPPAGLLLINPQSTLLDADGSVWRLFHPNGFGGKYWVGSQPGQRFHDLMEQARYLLDAKKRQALYLEATAILHEEKPWLELFQEVVVYGTSRRVTFRPRPDYRLIVSEMSLGQ